MEEMREKNSYELAILPLFRFYSMGERNAGKIENTEDYLTSLIPYILCVLLKLRPLP